MKIVGRVSSIRVALLALTVSANDTRLCLRI